jgi:hypothetical protein
MKTLVYRTQDSKKELVAKFKLSADADLFAYAASKLTSQANGVVWSVEDANYVITKYKVVA